MKGRENQANSGYMVLQDHDASWPLETREWRGAVRLTGKDKYGRRRTESAGDILCATAWEPSSRPFPGWAMAWPSISLGTQGDEGIGASGEDGDPNVGAEGEKGVGGAAGVAGAAGAAGGGGAGGGKGPDLSHGRSLGVRPGTSVGLNGVTVSRQNIGGRNRTVVDVGARLFTSGKLRWSAAGKQKKSEVTKYSKAWWKQQAANKKNAGGGKAAGGGAPGGAGDSGSGGVAGSNGSSGGRGAVTGGKSSDIGPRSVGIIPIRDEGHATDQRFTSSGCLIPDYWPSFPEGMAGIMLGGTEEGSQQEVWLPTDPRLFAVNKSPKGIMGSLVFDLEPEGKIAVGSGAPGIAGRGARLQTAWRVVRLPADPQHLEVEGLPCGNVIAWQGARTGQEKWPGLGAYTTVTGKSPKKQTEVNRAVTGGGGPISYVVQVGGDTSKKDDGGNKSVCAFTDFTAMGPFHGGFDDDKHKIDRTLDDERMHPVHVGTNAYYAMDEDRDAPLHFETLPYNANKFPMQARVHLVYDDTDVHPFFAETRRGMWKWYAEVPYLGSGSPPREPTDPPSPPRDPRPPPRPPPPTTPSEPEFFPPQMPGRPRYPGDPPTANPPKGFRGRGGKERNSGSHVWSPDTWGFGSMLWRPQHTRPNGQDFRVGGYSQADAQAEDASRPVVMRAEAWGKQTGLAWDYSRTPSASRYAGGEAAGGVLLLPGPVDMADSSVSWAPTDRNVQEAFFTAGPSVSIAWGLPDTTTGGLSDSSWRFHRDTTVGGYSSITMDVQVASVWTNALSLLYDANGIAVGAGGTAYFKVPSGTTAQRPASPSNGMVRYNTTTALLEARIAGAWKNVGYTQASGWTAPTGTDQRSGFATSTATLTDVAQTLKSLVGDLLTAGVLTA